VVESTGPGASLIGGTFGGNFLGVPSNGRVNQLPTVSPCEGINRSNFPPPQTVGRKNRLVPELETSDSAPAVVLVHFWRASSQINHQDLARMAGTLFLLLTLSFPGLSPCVRFKIFGYAFGDV
jgi:hypothetical protein